MISKLQRRYRAVTALCALLGCAGAAEEPLVTGVPLLRGSGSTAAAFLTRQILANASATGNAPLSLTYDAIGSGQGQRNFLQGTYDFAISDVPMQRSVYLASSRPIMQVPFAVSVFVIAHSIPGVPSGVLKLDRASLVKIFRCELTSWNDPALMALNPDIRLPAQDINVVVRKDASGSTQLISSYLALDKRWTAGSGPTVEWGKCVLGQQVQGSTEMVASIRQTNFSLGYLEYGGAFQGGLASALLENHAGQFKDASETNLSTNFLNTTYPNTTLSPDWANVSLVQAINKDPASNTYPVCSLEYLMLDLNQTSKGYPTGYILKELVDYFLSPAVQENLAYNGFVMLSTELRDIGRKGVKQLVTPQRPQAAESANLPETWVNVYY